MKNFLTIAKGSLIAILITLILLLIISALLTFTSISEGCIPVMIIIASAISILVGSIISSKKLSKKGILNGMIVGLIYIIVIYLLSSLFITGFSLNLKSLIMLVTSVFAGMLGGIIGVNLN